MDCSDIGTETSRPRQRANNNRPDHREADTDTDADACWRRPLVAESQLGRRKMELRNKIIVLILKLVGVANVVVANPYKSREDDSTGFENR